MFFTTTVVKLYSRGCIVTLVLICIKKRNSLTPTSLYFIVLNPSSAILIIPLIVCSTRKADFLFLDGKFMICKIVSSNRVTSVCQSFICLFYSPIQVIVLSTPAVETIRPAVDFCENKRNEKSINNFYKTYRK